MKSLYFLLSFLLLSASALFQPAHANSTPAEQDKLRIHTSLQKKPSHALFSYTAEWRVDNGDLYRATGISFLNAAKLDESSTAGLITKKLLTSLKDGLMQLEPVWRGITITQPKDQAELDVANKTGYSITSVTIRDYTNQALSYDLGDKTFSAEGVEIALDLVLATDIEFIEGFTTRRSDTASKGDIEISIDNQKPILIKTDGKTTLQLEEEISRHLAGSRISPTPLVSSFLSNYDKNNKPFDGSEVQLGHLAAKTIAIDIRDPELGVLTKFKFKDENKSIKVVDPMIMLPGLVIVSFLTAGYFLFKNSRKKPKTH
jgi:hypothetical protein